MINPRFSSLILVSAMLVGPAAAQAQAVTPAGTFGSLPAATFGGTGIPNNAVMTGGVNGATIGLTATPRFAAPAVTNDLAGTFFAAAGAPDLTKPGYAGWNFDWYINGGTSNSVFKLFVDQNPAAGNSLGSLLSIPLTPGQNSWNEGMAFLGGSFNPNATGEYSFALYQYSVDQTGALTEQDHVAMNVDVGATTTPEPSSVALLGTGFVGLGGFFKRRRKSA
ncbi:MAG: PEP-CTERM sorting domain-containing protein [Gemmatimonadaceae bacterium]